jgi:hypothetical protein
VLGTLLAVAGTVAHAGGPLAVRSNGQPFVWSTASAISYRTDNGPLSPQAGDDEAATRTRVQTLFNVWQNVATSNISYARATTDGGNGVGFINPVGAFAGGDVDTLAEFNAVEGDCGPPNAAQSPIMYDDDGVITDGLGLDTESVLGFAGLCALSSGGLILSGEAVLNGLFTNGITNAGATPPDPADVSDAEFDAVFIHEFGHFSGLDHAQINLNCLNAFPCGADDEAGLPTMFPVLIFASQGVLSDDDIAWISRLYPQTTGGTTFAGTHGTITGVVFFTDGQSHAQGVNVIARRVDTGANEDRTNAVSVVSGFKFTDDQDNPIQGSGGSGFGSLAPGDIGLFEIPVPAGSYTIEVESIDSSFTGGSSVGPLEFPIPMPGTAPAPSGTIVVAAGATNSGNNVTLINTDPRFDQFEDSALSKLILPADQPPWLRKRLGLEPRETS